MVLIWGTILCFSVKIIVKAENNTAYFLTTPVLTTFQIQNNAKKE
jgi:hypothetical protein